MYVKLENNIPVKWPIPEYELRQQRPNDSLPEYIPDALALEMGYIPFIFNGPSQHDPVWQDVEEITPVLKDGKYHQTYKITEKYTAEEKELKIKEETKRNNKQKAEQLLNETDWVEISSVSDTARIPHLVNFEEFMTYRMQIRAIAVSPSETEITAWPTKPAGQWSL
jgi:hypothetical protein